MSIGTSPRHGEVMVPELSYAAGLTTGDETADRLWHVCEAAHARVVALVDAHEAQEIEAGKRARYLRGRIGVGWAAVSRARLWGSDTGGAVAAGEVRSELRRLAEDSNLRAREIRAAFRAADAADTAYHRYAGTV
ncbi:MAG: hypothetical protein WCA46_01040 [Actinocatenispora sp.]